MCWGTRRSPPRAACRTAGNKAAAAAAAAQVSPATLSSWPQPAAAVSAPSASGSPLSGASALLSSNDTTEFLHLRLDTTKENTNEFIKF